MSVNLLFGGHFMVSFCAIIELEANMSRTIAIRLRFIVNLQRLKFEVVEYESLISQRNMVWNNWRNDHSAAHYDFLEMFRRASCIRARPKTVPCHLSPVTCPIRTAAPPSDPCDLPAWPAPGRQTTP